MATIFRPKADSYITSKKMVGCYIDREDAERISLHSINHGVSRSKVIETTLKKYLDTLPSLSELITNCAEKALKDWQDTQLKNLAEIGWKTPEQMTHRWNEYKKDLQVDLKTHRIPKDIIKEIIFRLEEMQIL